MTHTHDDLVYLAGLFDADGSVAVYPISRNTEGGAWAVHMTISNTDGRIMKWLTDKFGGNVTIKNGRQPTHKAIHEWDLGARKNRGLIEELVPFLRIKKIQVEYLLEFLDLMNKRGVKGISNLEERLELVADIKDEKLKEYPYVKRNPSA